MYTKTIAALLATLSLAAVAAPGKATAADASPETDPHIWLEDIDGARQIEWVKQRNAASTRELEAHPSYASLHDRLTAILDNKDRIPGIEFHGAHVYNFWQDAAHPRGIWRRTTLGSYRSLVPKWDTVLDLDALSKAEGKPWAWKGANCLEPAHKRCLLSLSPGGGDAVEIREFDTATKRFVAKGFRLPAAKSDVDWFDADTIWVGTDFGAGSLTTSGYPRQVKLWRRGTPLGQARLVFEGRAEDVAARGRTLMQNHGQRRYHLIERTPAFFKSDMHLYLDGRVIKLDLPADVELKAIAQDQLVIHLRSDWTVGNGKYRQGSLMSIGLDAFLAGSREFNVLFEPTERVAFGDLSATSKRLLMTTQDNVRSRLYTLVLRSGQWQREEIPLPGIGEAGLGAVDYDADRVTYSYGDFVTPKSLYLAEGGTTVKLKAMPTQFDANGIKVQQHEAISADGTRIPYFLITPKAFSADGNTPTVLYGYGGFEISMLPFYGAATGSSWLERGGAYVVANIRGGGEFGPAWHQAAQGHAHMKNFEDFIAVAEDLVARKVTSPKHLGIMGGSQGGLLVSATMALRPELFNAVVSQVPLADMLRYHKLLAGASWMAEYGNPDIAEDAAVIRTWSPYQKLTREAKYPKAFFWTTTRDDRVHPGHARKMVARMEELGHPVLYFENMEGGHGTGTTSRQKAQVLAMQWAYLWQQLR